MYIFLKIYPWKKNIWPQGRFIDIIFVVEISQVQPAFANSRKIGIAQLDLLFI